MRKVFMKIRIFFIDTNLQWKELGRKIGSFVDFGSSEMLRCVVG